MLLCTLVSFYVFKKGDLKLLMVLFLELCNEANKRRVSEAGTKVRFMTCK